MNIQNISNLIICRRLLYLYLIILSMSCDDTSSSDTTQVDCELVCEQEALCYEAIEQKPSSEIKSMCITMCDELSIAASIYKPQCLGILNEWKTCRYDLFTMCISQECTEEDNSCDISYLACKEAVHRSLW